MRPGLALYGVAPRPGAAAAGPAARDVDRDGRASPSAKLPAGTPLGYGGRFVTARDSTVAVLPIGYRDGFRRSFSGTASVLLRGRPAPVVGAVSMDVTLVDATATRRRNAATARSVSDGTAGPVSAWDLARAAGTIPYEILCGFGPRVRRVYAGRAPARDPRFLEAIGNVVLRLLEETGRFFIMLGRILIWTPRPPYDVRELFQQMERVGVNSIPVVFLTTLFTGMVLALQAYNGFARFNATGLVGSVVTLSLMRELSPVLSALMVTGRVGSSMAAEIGSMRVTEQIDALEALATEPVQYLFVPRVVASTLMMPLLVVMGDVIGMIGGYFVAVNLLGTNSVSYYENPFQYVDMNDFTSGMIKAGVLRPDLLGRRLRARVLHGRRRRGRRTFDDAGGRGRRASRSCWRTSS